jgi:hypothetical protein
MWSQGEINRPAIRRGLLGGALAIALCLAAAPAEAKQHPRGRAKHPQLSGDPARARDAYTAMQQQFYVASQALYQGNPYSFVWPFSQAMAATITLANVPPLRGRYEGDLQARRLGLDRYWDPGPAPAGGATVAPTRLPAYAAQVAPPLGPGGVKFYDDNAWIGIELVRLYQLQHNPADLARAEQVMAFISSGWDPDGNHPCSGGVPFSTAVNNTDRNVVTTAPSAELAAQLYRITRDHTYIDFTKGAYLWVRHCLLQSSQLYIDHVRFNGTYDQSVWSYNQGTMIGCGVMMYKITRDPRYLIEARRTANAALAYFTLHRLEVEMPFFASVLFRNLLLLDSVRPDPSYRRLIQAYLDAKWKHARLANNLFVFQGSTDLLTQAAFVQDYALLSSSPRGYF